MKPRPASTTLRSRLNSQTDAKLEIVGNASPDEKPEAAAQRAINIRSYLTQEKGIDKSRIELRVGDTSGRTARTAHRSRGGHLPATTGTQTFDESAIPASGQAYGTGRGTGGSRCPPCASQTTQEACSSQLAQARCIPRPRQPEPRSRAHRTPQSGASPDALPEIACHSKRASFRSGWQAS